MPWDIAKNYRAINIRLVDHNSSKSSGKRQSRRALPIPLSSKDKLWEDPGLCPQRSNIRGCVCVLGGMGWMERKENRSY